VEAEIKASHPDAKIKLIEGGGGVFDITHNGKLIFSIKNMQEQRFPDNGEIIKLIGKG
jgi:selenoprotein W-related protein